MTSKTKKGLVTAGGILVGAAAGGAAGMFAASKLIPDDPIPPVVQAGGKVLPQIDDEDEEGDDGDLFAETEEPAPQSAESIFMTSANLPAGDHESADYTPEV